MDSYAHRQNLRISVLISDEAILETDSNLFKRQRALYKLQKEIPPRSECRFLARWKGVSDRRSNAVTTK